MYQFVKNFLNNRIIKIKIANVLSRPNKIDNGVPQGSVISVTLFLLAINDIVNYISLPVKCTIFADDVTLFIKGKNLKTSESLIQQTLNKISGFANNSGSKF